MNKILTFTRKNNIPDRVFTTSTGLQALESCYERHYERIYDAHDNVPCYRLAVELFDDLSAEGVKLLERFNAYRGDCISSDREAAAFVFALLDM